MSTPQANRTYLWLFGAGALTLVVVVLAILLLGDDSPRRSAADTPSAIEPTTAGAPSEDFPSPTIARALGAALEQDQTFATLTRQQQAAMIEQSAAMLTMYHNTASLDELAELVGRWGGALRAETDQARRFLAAWWPPLDSRDRIADFDAARASVEALRSHITGSRDGEPVIRMKHRLPGRTGEVRGSAFVFDGAPPSDPDSTVALIVPARYADGSDAVIAFWFQWDAARGVWIPRWQEFEREGRPYAGAPLF